MAKSVVPDWGSEDEGSLEFESDDGTPYEVERIIAERKVDGETQYLVKWVEYGDEDCTWEPASSFDHDVTLLEWEKARERGDTLDPSELQDVEQKMARRRAEAETKIAAREDRSIVNPTRPEPPTNQETSVEKAVISKNTSMRKTATPPLPSVPAKRKLSISHSNESVQQTKPVRSKASPSTSGPARPQPVSIKSQVEPAHQNQVFYALSSDTRQTGRRTTGLSYTAASVARAGRPFRNLSHQNNAQKLRRQEPAPNINQLGALRPLADLPPVHDVALNLPIGPRPLHLARSPTREVYVEFTDGELQQVQNPVGFLTSPARSKTESIGPDTRRPEPPFHQEISHSMSYSAPRPEQSLLYIRYRDQFFHYKRGELVVQMSLGTRLIGHVKVVGLSEFLAKAILRTKDSLVLGMNFAQEDANNLKEYRSIELEVSATGSLEPYDNAKDEFYELLTFFNTHSKAVAVWGHETVPWTMVAYSSRAAAFVEKGYPTVPGGLAFFVCRRVPWQETPLSAAVSQPSRNDDNMLKFGEGTPNLGSSTLMDIDPDSIAAHLVEASHVSQTVSGLESRDHGRTTILDARDVKSMNEAFKQTALGSINIAELTFEKKYGISYEKLTYIPTTVKPLSDKGRFKRNMASFFLAFDEEKIREEAELKRWLTSRPETLGIYSSSDKDAWDSYKVALRAGDYIGTILIYEDFVLAALRIMKNLAKELSHPNLQVFRVCLERPLQDLTPRHFGRIFPSGFVLLITEGTIFGNAMSTANMLGWFAAHIKGKPRWRLFLRPQPQDYLRDLCETNISKEDLSWHEKSLLLLERKLQASPSTTSSPLISSPDDLGSPGCVLAPINLPVFSSGDEESSLVTSNTRKISERDEMLINFFCGWAFDQISSFRRFVAITTNTPKDFQERNSHVYFLTPEEFAKLYMVKKDSAKVKMPENSPMSPAVESAVTNYMTYI